MQSTTKNHRAPSRKLNAAPVLWTFARWMKPGMSFASPVSTTILTVVQYFTSWSTISASTATIA